MAGLAKQTGQMYATAFESAVNARKLFGGMALRDFYEFAIIHGERVSINPGLAQAATERATVTENSVEAQGKRGGVFRKLNAN